MALAKRSESPPPRAQGSQVHGCGHKVHGLIESADILEEDVVCHGLIFPGEALEAGGDDDQDLGHFSKSGRVSRIFQELFDGFPRATSLFQTMLLRTIVV